jgi:phosphoglycolate phosphatase
VRIFFDLDGPILDVSKRYYKVFIDITGAGKISKDIFWSFKREKKPWKNIFKQAGLNLNEKIFLRKWFSNIEKRKYLKLDTLQCTVKKVLATLRKKNSLYLISLRQSKSNLLWQLKYLGLDWYFDKVIYCKNTKNYGWLCKAKLIKQNLSSDEESIIIGDTEIDIRAAKLAKITSIAVLCGIREKKLLVKEKPDQIISDIRSLIKFIK